MPEFPETAPDPEVRNVEPPPAPNPWAIAKEQRKKRKTTAAEGEASKVSFLSGLSKLFVQSFIDVVQKVL